MHVFMTPQEAAPILRCCDKTIRNRIKNGVITHVITNGYTGNSTRYLIDMTLEFGIEEIDGRDYLASMGLLKEQRTA